MNTNVALSKVAVSIRTHLNKEQQENLISITFQWYVNIGKRTNERLNKLMLIYLRPITRKIKRKISQNFFGYFFCMKKIA